MAAVTTRVDFLQDGSIIPLSYIDKNGKTIRIDRILAVEKNKVSNHFGNWVFLCRAGSCRIWLQYNLGIWEIVE